MLFSSTFHAFLSLQPLLTLLCLAVCSENITSFSELPVLACGRKDLVFEALQSCLLSHSVPTTSTWRRRGLWSAPEHR